MNWFDFVFIWSQVTSNFRSSITIPRQGLSKFKDIVCEYALTASSPAKIIHFSLGALNPFSYPFLHHFSHGPVYVLDYLYAMYIVQSFHTWENVRKKHEVMLFQMNVSFQELFANDRERQELVSQERL